jgi:AcrR family transcriptional regulator
VDNVNMPYHHGHLRQALVDSAVELARAGGPDAVVLRAASRAAGVSHNAAYRHFADRDDLLRAVCERCMDRLAEMMEAGLARVGPAPGPDAAWDRLRAAGQAYVDFALSEPGWFRTAFGVPHTVEPIGSRPRDPYRILSETLDELVAEGALPPSRRPGAEYPPWAAVHGISTLLLDGPLRDLPAPARAAAIDKVLEGAITGL